jgi:hypothetical protein
MVYKEKIVMAEIGGLDYPLKRTKEFHEKLQKVNSFVNYKRCCLPTSRL